VKIDNLFPEVSEKEYKFSLFSFPPLTEMFHFSGYTTLLCSEIKIKKSKIKI